MPRRPRPVETTRSEHWLRVAVNQCPEALNARIASIFRWEGQDRIEWRSPVESDEYAEYYDQAFLDRLGVAKLEVPLGAFWPASGPRWDGLGRTASGKLILVEAKAYIEEGVDYASGAGEKSAARITKALDEAKAAFRASERAIWERPFYQYANRLAHLYFLRHCNGLDAYLLFLYFADASDVDVPCSEAEWRGATRLVEKALGLSRKHPFRSSVGTLIWSVPDMGQLHSADIASPD